MDSVKFNVQFFFTPSFTWTLKPDSQKPSCEEMGFNRSCWLVWWHLPFTYDTFFGPSLSCMWKSKVKSSGTWPALLFTVFTHSPTTSPPVPTQGGNGSSNSARLFFLCMFCPCHLAKRRLTGREWEFSFPFSLLGSPALAVCTHTWDRKLENLRNITSNVCFQFSIHQLGSESVVLFGQSLFTFSHVWLTAAFYFAVRRAVRKKMKNLFS